MHKLEIQQRLLPHPWPLLLGVVIFLVPVSLLLLNNSAGPEEYGEEIWPLLLVLSIAAVVFGLAMNSSTHIVLSKDGIRYRFAPLLKQTRFLHRKDILDWKIIDYSFWKFRGLGFRTNLKGDRFYIMRPGKVLEVTTGSGKKIWFGIDHPGRIRHFIRVNWEEKD